jgi:hypothetical protein
MTVQWFFGNGPMLRPRMLRNEETEEAAVDGEEERYRRMIAGLEMTAQQREALADTLLQCRRALFRIRDEADGALRLPPFLRGLDG